MDIRRKYDGHDRLHELLRTIYQERTGQDPVPERQQPAIEAAERRNVEAERDIASPASTSDTVSRSSVGASGSRGESSAAIAMGPPGETEPATVRTAANNRMHQRPTRATRASTRNQTAEAASASQPNSSPSERSRTPSPRDVTTQRSTRSRAQVDSVAGSTSPANANDMQGNERHGPASPRVEPPRTPVNDIPIEVSVAHAPSNNDIVTRQSVQLGDINTLQRLHAAILTMFGAQLSAAGLTGPMNFRNTYAFSPRRHAREHAIGADVSQGDQYGQWVALVADSPGDFEHARVRVVVQADNTRQADDAARHGNIDKDQYGNDNDQGGGSEVQDGTSSLPGSERSEGQGGKRTAPKTASPRSKKSQKTGTNRRSKAGQRQKGCKESTSHRGATFTESEEETDQEEMIEVPRNYFHRLEDENMWLRKKIGKSLEDLGETLLARGYGKKDRVGDELGVNGRCPETWSRW